MPVGRRGWGDGTGRVRVCEDLIWGVNCWAKEAISEYPQTGQARTTWSNTQSIQPESDITYIPSSCGVKGERQTASTERVCGEFASYKRNYGGYGWGIIVGR